MTLHGYSVAVCETVACALPAGRLDMPDGVGPIPGNLISTSLLTGGLSLRGYQKAIVPDARKVLIVEDEIDIREILWELFSREGYDVRTAGNGLEALREMSDEVPDVVLLDLMMPVMSGWELVEAMQQDPKLASVPVVVLTGTTRPMPRGPARFFRKPVDFGSLLAAVGGLCS